MIVIAILRVTDFEALARFEHSVAPILSSVGAKILHAIEVHRHADGTGEEVHVLYFPDEESFENYKIKTNDESIKNLRSTAISSIDIKIEKAHKQYGQ